MAFEETIRLKREAAWAEVLNLKNLQETKNNLESSLGSLDEKLSSAEANYQEALMLSQGCSATLQKALYTRLHHREFYPKWWMVLITFGKEYREWRAPDLIYQKEVQNAEEASNSALVSVRILQTELQTLRTEKIKTEALLTETETEFQLSLQKISHLHEDLKTHFPFTNDFATDESFRELSSPWMDEEWSIARAQVFLCALDLHREFIHANAKEFRQNLDALSDVLSGNLPPGVTPDAVRAAWDAQFLVTPVVSTTFASFDRLFAFHGESSIGWLFVDEAGQATPQAAAGAVFRAQRAVVVGDPLQLEPILSLPFTAQDSLRKPYKVDPFWRPGQLSCQRLADKASLLGTWIPTSSDPLWVGTPLRVHRRCDQPMFSISNQIAYDCMMIFGTTPKDEKPWPKSSWIDVSSTQADSHWIPEEGIATDHLLEQLFSQGATPNDIFLISPFRAVVQELRQYAKSYDGLRVGTIHTVQGKEADIVILVLGGNPNKPGAKDWAAKKPNLANVAVSRAKRRIYVIGDLDQWRRRQHFNILASLVGRFDTLGARDFRSK